MKNFRFVVIMEKFLKIIKLIIIDFTINKNKLNLKQKLEKLQKNLF
jgi:hypothetical protein